MLLIVYEFGIKQRKVLQMCIYLNEDEINHCGVHNHFDVAIRYTIQIWITNDIKILCYWRLYKHVLCTILWSRLLDTQSG